MWHPPHLSAMYGRPEHTILLVMDTEFVGKVMPFVEFKAISWCQVKAVKCTVKIQELTLG